MAIQSANAVRPTAAVRRACVCIYGDKNKVNIMFKEGMPSLVVFAAMCIFVLAIFSGLIMGASAWRKEKITSAALVWKWGFRYRELAVDQVDAEFGTFLSWLL